MTMPALIRDQERRFAEEDKEDLLAQIEVLSQELALAHVTIEELESRIQLERGQRVALR